MIDTFWAIVGKHGFYTGTYLRRADAISSYCRDLAMPGQPVDVKRDWAKYKALGDMAVRVRLSIVEPSASQVEPHAPLNWKAGLTFRDVVNARYPGAK